MGLIGNIIGSTVGTGIKLWAGHKANKKIQQNIDMFNDTVNKYQTQQASNQAYYDSIQNEDAASNANTMAAINAAQQINQENNEQATAQKILTGGTDESVAHAKAQGAQTVGQMLNNAAVQNQQRQENAHAAGSQSWLAYQQATDAVNNKIADARTNQAKVIQKQGEEAAQGVAKASRLIKI